jgi:hypothetical protein
MLTAVEHVLATSLGPKRWDSSNTPLLVAYATAPQHVGREALALSPAELDELRAAAPGIGFERWTRDDAARALLLIARRNNGRTGDAFVSDALECFEQGDAREQQSWLRAIALWPEAEKFLPQAIDACRTNIIPVFEALACENPYPAAHFPERNFNQMVLKAMFNTIALARIVGRAGRLNPELTRMARDYAAERTAAGRTVPADINLAFHDAA